MPYSTCTILVNYRSMCFTNIVSTVVCASCSAGATAYHVDESLQCFHLTRYSCTLPDRLRMSASAQYSLRCVNTHTNTHRHERVLNKLLVLEHATSTYWTNCVLEHATATDWSFRWMSRWLSTAEEKAQFRIFKGGCTLEATHKHYCLRGTRAERSRTGYASGTYSIVWNCLVVQ